jgi:hypothetical protein
MPKMLTCSFCLEDFPTGVGAEWSGIEDVADAACPICLELAYSLVETRGKTDAYVGTDRTGQEIESHA